MGDAVDKKMDELHAIFPGYAGSYRGTEVRLAAVEALRNDSSQAVADIQSKYSGMSREDAEYAVRRELGYNY